ncbi:5-hydroxytryptamine receptor 3A [Dissostichus eleginoides]|uniref:5-hydroxytryptamine receptor 3A n=1 Tax=Dissostichus eleginoides TaxID=100907 RepID=A0AAD9BG56_DISEL|nr:5-hydroxytryptamine receptor 3A [Dissostichus eleginoides]
MFTGFLFLLLLTGGSSWNTTELPELLDDLTSNHSFEASGETFNNSEQQELNGQLSDKDNDNDDSKKRKFTYEDVLNYLNLTKTKEKLVRPVKDYTKATWVHVQMSILAILDVKWEDPYIYWKPKHFGELDKMRVSVDLVWKPDLMFEEMIEKDKAVPNPFITINSNGFVEHVRDLMVVSTCRMQVYKFPFDVQSCTLSLKSIVYPVEELKFEVLDNSTVITEWTRQMMRNEFEWLFIDMAVEDTSVPHFYQNQSVLIYTLILNDILPSSSDRIPLIAVYCIGMFGLMMVSLLETILVMYLIEKDSASKEKKADKNCSLSEDCGDKQGNYDGDVKKWTHCACVCNVSDEPPSELLSVAKEDKRSQLMEESNSLEKLPDELMSAVFLVVIFSVWINAKDE